MVTTSDMREAWAPACNSGAMLTMPFGDNGARITANRLTVPVWTTVEAIFDHVGYEIRHEDTGAYNCRIITGGSDYSLHAYGIAVDVNWQSNPYGSHLVTNIPAEAIRLIEAIRPKAFSYRNLPVVRWGGRYSGNKDAMHFEVVVPPAALASGITAPINGFTEAEMRALMRAINSRASYRQAKATRANVLAQGRRLGAVEASIKRLEGKIDQLLDAA